MTGTSTTGKNSPCHGNSSTMRRDKWNTRELIGKSTYWVGRNFKPIWKLSGTSYADAKERAYRLCNQIRKDHGLPEYTGAKFDEGWQYRTVFDDSYLAAREEFINLVFGWW